ncbi:MAG: GntR family transcriptional regulator [Hyphomonadaceae bacterium]|nr:GntR family transcriptional regulator [Clostridia bacterium]
MVKKIEQPYEHDTSSLRARVFTAIEEGILSGRIAQGQSLIETKLSDELGVSRTPVREAIRQLELEGLVRIVPNKGAVALGISAQDIDDIYAIRMLIEGLAARWAVEKITHDEIDQLKESVDLFEFYVKRNDMGHLQEMDSRFHELIYEACKSNPLRQTLTNFHHYIKRARVVSFESPGRAKKALDEHKAILNAIIARDSNKAEQLTCEHVRNAKANVKHEEDVHE